MLTASTRSQRVGDVTVVVLDRPPHAELIGKVRATGRGASSFHGNVTGGSMPSLLDSGVDRLLGVSGSPEAITYRGGAEMPRGRH